MEAKEDVHGRDGWNGRIQRIFTYENLIIKKKKSRSLFFAFTNPDLKKNKKQGVKSSNTKIVPY